MNEATLKNYANRLGIHDSETIEKSKELLRLVKLKSTSTIAKETAKIVLCIEWASILCGTNLDHDQAVKLSGLNKTDYKRQKDLIDKLLSLSKKLTLDEICAQLEINDRLKNDARQLFNQYIANESHCGDANSTSILAMAIYQSLKLRKMKNSQAKASLLHISKLNPKAWKQLEEHWDTWIEKFSPLKVAAAAAAADQRARTDESKFRDDEAMDTTSDDTNDFPQTHTELSYEEWRDSMISKAKALLKAKTQQQNQMDQSN